MRPSYPLLVLAKTAFIGPNRRSLVYMCQFVTDFDVRSCTFESVCCFFPPYHSIYFLCRRKCISVLTFRRRNCIGILGLAAVQASGDFLSNQPRSYVTVTAIKLMSLETKTSFDTTSHSAETLLGLQPPMSSTMWSR